MKLTNLALASCLALGSAGVLLADFDIKGTIPVTKHNSSEWPSLAKITPDEAKAIALKQVPGRIDKFKLDEEDGYLVYEVQIVNKDFIEHELLIDAGDGKVLEAEQD